jgi:flavodoxin
MSIAIKDAITASPNVLIVFYSHSGNTRALAGLIHQQVGGDLVEIQPVAPYPSDYNTVINQAKQELKSGYKPPLKTTVANLAAYDVILIGSPNWWNTFAPPVQTFLSQNDLSGKAVVPFITHEGTGLGRSVRDIAAFCPKSTVLDGLAVWGEEANTARNQVSEWLRKLGMEQLTGR